MSKQRVLVTTVLLQRRGRELQRHLPTAAAGDDHGVHQARVATRRLREMVPVLASGVKGSKAGKAGRKIRRLTRALGTVRELDVTLHLLGDLAEAGDHPRTAIEEVRAHVVAERDRRRPLMLQRLERVNASKLSRRLASVAEAVEHHGQEQWKPALAARLMNRSKRLVAAIDGAGKIYAPEQLHQVRIAAKKLRYGLELASDTGVGSAVPLLRPIKRAQALLGKLHDRQVLQSHVAAVQGSDAADRPGMHVALESVSRHLEDECRRLHGRYLMSAEALRQLCERVRSKVVPSLHPPRARRSLKMALESTPVPAVARGNR